MTSRIAERRDGQRQALIDAAERAIVRDGLAGLKARDLAVEIGVSLGAIYNLVEDLDELALRVASRTLSRLEAALAVALLATGGAAVLSLPSLSTAANAPPYKEIPAAFNVPPPERVSVPVPSLANEPLPEMPPESVWLAEVLTCSIPALLMAPA